MIPGAIILGLPGTPGEAAQSVKELNQSFVRKIESLNGMSGLVQQYENKRDQGMF